MTDPTRALRPPSTTIVAAAVAAGALSLCWTLGLPALGIGPGHAGTESVQTLINTALQAFATIVLFRGASRQRGRHRVAWSAVAAGSMFGTFGTGIASISMIVTGTTETIAAVDVLYALALLAAGTGVALLPPSDVPSRRIRSVDTAILALATLTLVWVTPVDARADGRTIPGLPTVDVFEAVVLATLLVAAGAVARSRPDRHGEVGLAAGALMCSGVGLLLYSAPSAGYSSASRTADAVFAVGFVLAGSAGLRLCGPGRSLRRRGSDLDRHWLALPEIATVTTLVAVTVHERVDSTPLLSIAVAVTAVVLALGRLLQLAAEQNQLSASLHESVDLLYREARTDRLTGLGNRLAFEEHLRTTLTREQRNASTDRTAVTLWFADVDHFKKFNDALGHAVGDGLLVEVARRLSRTLGPRTYRIGGDEFVAIVDGLDEQAAAALADSVLRSFDEPVVVGDHEMGATVSIGRATWTPEGAPDSAGPSAADLARRADLALYRSKDLGRGCSTAYSPALAERVEHDRQLRQDLRVAAERDQFEVHHAPVVHLRSRHVVGTTVSLHWRSPQHGVLGPDLVVPLAAETGLLPTTATVLFDEIRRILCATEPGVGEPREPLWVGVRLSRDELVHPALTELIIGCTGGSDASGRRASRLRIDITELTVVDEAALEVLAGLRQLGVPITVDGFGTGPSSLLRLSHYPASAIRVDQSFVHGLGRRRDDTVIITAVAELATDLGLAMSADGIEEDFQATYLEGLGFIDGRGRLFGETISRAQLIESWGRPVPPVDATITGAQL